MRCAVIGAGAWGTALADLLGAQRPRRRRSGRSSRTSPTSINERHENRRFLAGCHAARRRCARRTISRDGARRRGARRRTRRRRTICAASPRRGARFVERDAIARRRDQGHRARNARADDDVVARRGARASRSSALSGPSFAAEVVARQPTAIVAASDDRRRRRARRRTRSATRRFRVYTHDDVIGVELGGALKNVMAVATGIVEGVGLGFNSRAALITRGLAEMTRLGIALGAQPATFAGLAGIGDLVLTCTGALSRNRALGIEIGKGATLEAGARRQGDGRRGRRHDGERARAGERVRRRHADRARWCIAFCSTDTPRADAVPELMARELRAEQDA